MAPSTGPNAAPAVEAEGLTKTYGGFTAVNSLSFTLERGAPVMTDCDDRLW